MTTLPIFTGRYDADTIAYDIQKILEKQYTPGIDKVKSYGLLDSGRIAGEFIAGRQTFFYSIDPRDGSFTYRPATTSKQDSWLRFDAKAKIKAGAKTAANKAGKTLVCSEGKTYPCGKVCRAFGKPCKSDPDAESRALAQKAAEKIGVAAGTAKAKGKTATTSSRSSAQKTKSMTEEDRQEKIREYLRIKKIDHGKAFLEELHGVDDTPADPAAVAALEKFKTNLIPVNVKRRDDDEFEVLTGHEWVKAARQMGSMDSLWVNIIDGDVDPQELMALANIGNKQPSQSGGAGSFSSSGQNLSISTSQKERAKKRAQIPVTTLTEKPTQEQLFDIIGSLDREVGSRNYLPIFYLRDHLKPLLSRDELDKMLYKLERDDKIEMSSLVNPIPYTPEEIETGIPKEIGGRLFFIVQLDENGNIPTTIKNPPR